VQHTYYIYYYMSLFGIIGFLFLMVLEVKAPSKIIQNGLAHFVSFDFRVGYVEKIHQVL
jgi:hypothetical protein